MTNNKMYIIANWKMHDNSKSFKSLKRVAKLSNLKIFRKLKIIYCPTYTQITELINIFRKSKVEIGAQNCHHISEEGPYTGKVNARIIKKTGAKFVIIGHSETRSCGETLKNINHKIKSAIKENLKVILCIGETSSDKRKNKTKKVIERQIITALKNNNIKENLFIAYEPVWAIGSGIIPTNKELKFNLDLIKKILSKIGKKNIDILYGGSVNPKNINKLKLIKNIDGFLIGGASQDPKKFIDIIKKTYN